MSYIDESLAANEAVVYRARFHWVQKAGTYIAWILLNVMALVCVALVPGRLALLVAGMIAALGLIHFAAMMIHFWTTEVGVTNQRFIFKRGWLRRVTDELQLSAIEEVNLKQSVLGRLLGYGRLILHGTGVNDIRLPLLADPVGLRRALQESMGAANASVAVAQPAEDTPPSPAAA
jgi:PH (Pleckstrin Homology) domain-containing protein